MSITTAQAKTLLGTGSVWAADGPIGRIESFYLDPAADHPTWVAVVPSAGEPATVIPLDGSYAEDGHIIVPCSKSLIDAAPRLDAGSALTPEQLQVLEGHYFAGDATPRPVPSADASMVRSEERLVVSTVVRPVRRLRLAKRIVTEYVTQTIPLRREEFVIEDEVLDASSREMPPAPTALTGQVFDFVLHEERPVITTEVVAVERVHVAVVVTTDRTTVSSEVARENVVVETTGVDETTAGGPTS